MNKPFLLFQGGTHGNFLAKCLSVASGECDNFDFYKGLKGAHNKSKTMDYVVDFGHEPIDDDIFYYINVNEDDLYILSWHIFYAAGEFGVDFLKVNDFDSLHKTCMDNPEHPIVAEGFGNQVSKWSKQGQSGLREMFKMMFNQGNGIITKQGGYYFACKIQNTFEFSWFYDIDKFTDNLKIILDKLGLSYKVDISKNWEQFITMKNNIIKSKELVEYAFTCYNKDIPVNISNFCVYEQAYLDYLIEKQLGYKMENWQRYPTNTKDLKPKQAWEGKRYDL